MLRISSKVIFELLIVLILFFETNFLNYTPLQLPLVRSFTSITSFIFIPFVFIAIHRFQQTSNLERLALLLLSWPVFTILVKIFVDDTAGIAVVFDMSFMFGIFFFFKSANIDEKSLIRAILIFSIISWGCQLWQQLHPYSQLFHSDDNTSIRNGLIRFHVGHPLVQLFSLFYCWNQLLKKINIKYLILSLIFLSSVYLFLTRQLILSTVIVIAISFLFLKRGKTRIYGAFIVCIATGLLFYFSDYLFADFIDYTQTNTYSTDIRQIAAVFFWEQSIDNPIQFIVGHGFTTQELTWMDKGLFASDVGFIGSIYHFGIVWFIIYIWTLYTLLIKNRKVIPTYIKMFLFCTMITSVMIFPYVKAITVIIWSSVLYISNLYTKQRR